MLCSHCKAPIKEGDAFCSHCGQEIPKQIQSNGGAPWWIKLLISLAILFALIFGWRSLNTHDELGETIQGQLTALRNNHLTEAYYDYGSREFEGSVTLNAFREFIDLYPILSHNKGIEFTERKTQDNVAEVKGTLTGTDNTSIPIEYTLVKEKEKWRILNMRLPSLSSAAAEIQEFTDKQASSELTSIINAQLKAIKDKDVTRAYQDYSSNSFKQTTPLDKFITFVQQLPILTTFEKLNVNSMLKQEDMVEVFVTLDPDKNPLPVIYEFITENGKWKIRSMLVSEPLSPAMEALLKDPIAMRKPIEDQLQAMKENDVSKAYSYVTKDFRALTTQEAFSSYLKRYPILSHYDSFDIKELKEGILQVHLHDKNGTTTFEYFMGIEDDQWKINGLRAQAKSAER